MAFVDMRHNSSVPLVKLKAHEVPLIRTFTCIRSKQRRLG
jgi:hypothetical protein